jgi:autotransporter strand-loop-strand O-heptosyltransferase
MIKVRAHTCYLGKTGYASHAREFFRSLSAHVDLRVRNYTWDSNPEYLNDTDLSIIDSITLRDSTGGGYSDYHISHSFPGFQWKNQTSDFDQDVDIVLMDMDHHYFYEEYKSRVKIAYTVWESTELPEGFFNQLLKFDYLWVVSEWHKEVAIKQGYPAYRVFVVNEGVNSEFLSPVETLIPREENDGRFKLMFFGRWDYRKSVPEIISSFLKAFPNNEPVDLILSADNPYSVDGMKSTEERLDRYDSASDLNFKDPRIKIKHFVSREDYVSYIKNGNVLVTCARSEGWNIPLIEAMAAGTPVIYSNWGAQLEFCEGKGNPVNIKEELPASIGAHLGFAGDTPGLYAEPDYDRLVEVMKDCYYNYSEKKGRAIEESWDIKQRFNWNFIGKQGFVQLLKVCGVGLPKPDKKESVVILSHADTEEKISLLRRCLITLKRQGYFTIISSHIGIPDNILKNCDYFICETDNPVVTEDEYRLYSDTIPVHFMSYPDFELTYPFDFNHGYAALRLIINGANISKTLGFDKTHYVNYDYIIDNEETLNKHADLLRENSIVSYKWNPEGSINSAFFSGDNDELIKSLSTIKSKKDYFKYRGVVILEDFMYKIFEESNLRLWTGQISDINSGNFLNSVIIPTYPRVKSNTNDRSYIYLGNDHRTDKDYICVFNWDELMECEIIKDNTVYSITSEENSSVFYQLDPGDLEKGVTVNLPKYNQIFRYNKTSKKASVNIKNEKLIIKGPGGILSNKIFNVNFYDGPFIEIKGAGDREFIVDFIDGNTGETHYSTHLKNNQWAKCSIKYYKNWLIKITDKNSGEVYEERMNLSKKRVLVSIESSSLGDNIAWFPHIEEFRKIHDCEIYVSTFKNDLFKENYPDINFIIPGGSIENIYAVYRIGWFYKDSEYNKELHPRDFKSISMQATSTDILGLPHYELRPKISTKKSESPVEGNYVCLGFHSTAQAKYWNNPKGWQELVDWLISEGNEVVMISNEGDGFMGNKYPEGIRFVEGEKTLENAIRYIKNSKMFIGIGSGLSWLSWALDVPTVLISGFSNPYTEFLGNNVIRIFNESSCNSCFNRKRLDAGDWNWCPDHKGTERQFECTKTITSEFVINEIKKYQLSQKLENELDWGQTSEWYREIIKKEIFEDRIYERFNQVVEGDIVVDFGASIGPFTKSIMDKKPESVFTFEPCIEEYRLLVKNIEDKNVIHLNAGIANENSERIKNDNLFFFGEEKQNTMRGITFNTFLEQFSIDRIDFLKTDCEGGEYSIFTEENFDWISKNVKKIAGEWHLGEYLNPGSKEKFRKFRDLYLKRMPNHQVYSIDGVDIKWDLWNENFLNFYTEVIVYIDNTQDISPNKGSEESYIEEVIKESYDLGMLQNHKEILEASRFFKSLNVKNFMEIGTDQGGTFAVWGKLSKDKDGIRISVDLPHGPYGVNTYDPVRRDEYLKSLGTNVTTIHGSSHSEEIKEKVKEILNGELLDFLFIDGDHTYEGVKQDYYMYKEFVKDGGWIGFHDTKNTEFHRNANCRVDLLWSELEGEKIDFIDETSEFGGIGFIKKI